ncbi:MAG: signal peptidase II [Halobacteriovoraceae bacterium]|nr:signal peptidase II [Halobacteriovoraceae bacterium]
MNRIWQFAIMITIIVLADQFSKGIVESNFYHGETLPVIDGFFNITYIRNPGAAFGFLATAPKTVRQILFLFLPVIICGWLVVLIWQNRHKPFFLSLSYSLILAGAIGNLIDRFTLSYVVDFLDFYWGRHHYPAFNIADSCITTAAGMLLIDYFMQWKKDRKADSS